MKRARVIPVLLLHEGGLVKTIRFKNPSYVGDPINAVKIFNEKEIDEIVIVDIDASRKNLGPNFNLLREIAGEAFVPLAYGGGISKLEEVNELFYLGVEKVIFNKQAYYNSALLSEVASLIGSQSVVASIDVKKGLFGGYKVALNNGTELTKWSPIEYARKLQDIGAGEIFLNFVDRDGTYQGYDQDFISKISAELRIPLVVCGGASSLKDFQTAIKNGASAVAAGSFFVYQRPHNAVLISYPSRDQLLKEVYQ